MCQSAHPFYGLTLAPEDKVRIHQEIFHLIYNSNGAFTHDEAYSLPISLRYFYLRTLIEQKDKENEQAKRQENQSSPKSKPVARPPLVRK
jgi:hypothetical protein